RRRQPASPDGLEDVHRADDVHTGPERRIGPAERDLERGQVYHVRDPVLRERALEGVEVGYVAVDLDDALDLPGRGDLAQPVLARAREIERHNACALTSEQCRRPGADAAAGAGDEEALLCNSLLQSGPRCSRRRLGVT